MVRTFKSCRKNKPRNRKKAKSELEYNKYKEIQKEQQNIQSLKELEEDIKGVKMTNIVDVTYNQTGESKSTNHYGMRQMQERAYAARNAQYLLLKAPPASGKSRALMFVAHLININPRD